MAGSLLERKGPTAVEITNGITSRSRAGDATQLAASFKKSGGRRSAKAVKASRSRVRLTNMSFDCSGWPIQPSPGR